MNNLIGSRSKMNNGEYSLTLEVADKEFFCRYDDANLKYGEDLVRNYLIDMNDDADFCNTEIKHNKNRQIVTITANLTYNNNIHTDIKNKFDISK